MFWKKKKKSNVENETGSQTEVVKKTTKSSAKRKFLPLEVKLMAMEAMDEGLSSKDVSEVVGSSHVTIEKWYRIWRAQGQDGFVHRGSTPTIRCVSSALKKKIEEFRIENPEAGVRKIRDELKRNDALKVSAETVRKVVNEAGLGNPAPKSKRRPPQIRRFERELPNAMWQTDIFTFELKRMYKVYLIGFIDDHSRYIVAHGLFRQQTAEAVQEVLQGAIGQWGAPREILSDNGRQYASWRGKTKFQKTLTRQGVQHVRSAPHHPMTLGKIERFWKTIWTEFLEDTVFASFADARQRIDHWIGYYNHQRPHQGIGGGVPADRFYGIAGDVEEALKQGCKENALQLALGQETRPPLYLLGKLGETDVRVTRKGDEIELKLGDTVHETIKMGTAFTIENEEAANDTLEGNDRGAEVSGTGDDEDGSENHQRDLRDVRSESDHIEQGDDEVGASCDGSSDAEVPREKSEGRGPVDYGTFEEECIFGGGSETVENEV